MVNKKYFFSQGYFLLFFCINACKAVRRHKAKQTQEMQVD